MRKIFISLIVLLFSPGLCAQDFSISPPKLNFDGNQLTISYDLLSGNVSDKFFVWIEIERPNGETLLIKAVSGDIGDNIQSGNDKKVIWYPEKDSLFLNESVLVAVKAEKYKKSFNKGSAILLSTVMPGLGQTKISKGKPWWLTGVSSYGLLIGGFLTHKKYTNTFNSYRLEEDPLSRSELFDKAQKQLNLSNTLIISGAAVWVANLIWVAAIPNKYQTLKHLSFSLDNSSGHSKPTTLVTMQINF